MHNGIHERDLSPTELAEDRTLLANERTFASWTRTSLGCIAIGLGFHAFFSKIHPPWVPKGIASLFLILSAIMIRLAARRAAAVMGRLDPHVVVTGRKVNVELIASAVTLGAGALGIVIWFLPVG